MPRRQVATTIGGVEYRLKQLGGDAVAELGDRVLEAMALSGQGVPALATATRAVRQALVAESIVMLDDQGSVRPVRLKEIFDDHFAGERAEYMGQWFAWAVKESGLPAFLGGALKRLIPSLVGRLPSVFRTDAAGSPTVSSSATGSA